MNAALEAQLAGEVQGKLYRQAGKDALMGSILEAGLSAYQGYKFGQELQTPSGPPAPLEYRTTPPSGLSTTRPATLARPGESVAFNR